VLTPAHFPRTRNYLAFGPFATLPHLEQSLFSHSSIQNSCLHSLHFTFIVAIGFTSLERLNYVLASKAAGTESITKSARQCAGPFRPLDQNRLSELKERNFGNAWPTSIYSRRVLPSQFPKDQNRYPLLRVTPKLLPGATTMPLNYKEAMRCPAEGLLMF
jgi:hypothetical protein